MCCCNAKQKYQNYMTLTSKLKWSFIGKWITFDTEQGEPSNQVVCPGCSSLLERDPTARPLVDQTPDSTLKCLICERQFN